MYICTDIHTPYNTCRNSQILQHSQLPFFVTQRIVLPYILFKKKHEQAHKKQVKWQNVRPMLMLVNFANFESRTWKADSSNFWEESSQEKSHMGHQRRWQANNSNILGNQDIWNPVHGHHFHWLWQLSIKYSKVISGRELSQKNKWMGQKNRCRKMRGQSQEWLRQQEETCREGVGGGARQFLYNQILIYSVQKSLVLIYSLIVLFTLKLGQLPSKMSENIDR